MVIWSKVRHTWGMLNNFIELHIIFLISGRSYSKSSTKNKIPFIEEKKVLHLCFEAGDHGLVNHLTSRDISESHTQIFVFLIYRFLTIIM